MKYCPNCGSGIADEATFCPTCGNSIAANNAPQPQAPNYGNYNAPYGNPGYGAPAYAPAPAKPAFDPTDHTAEFEAQDISDNKVVCMLIYLAGYIGIFVALLLAGTSKYVSFHVRQALKIQVVSLLFGIVYAAAALIVTLLAFIPILGWIIAFLYGLIGIGVPIALFVVQVICFVQICKGKAKEPALISKLGFLK